MFLFIIGILSRIFTYLYIDIPNLPHFSSVYTDFKTAQEGLSYKSLNLSPYFPDSAVHISPIILTILSILEHKHLIFGFVLAIDILNAIFLYLMTKSKSVLGIYLCNPISIISTASLNLVSLNHLAVLTFGYFTFERRRIRAVMSIGFLSYLDPCLLPIASLWYFNHFTKRIYILGVLMTFGLYASSYFLAGETWGWLSSCQISQVLNYDIKPNIGISWYLILEMFKRYQLLYRSLLALHPWLYLYPLYKLLQKYFKFTSYKQISNLYFSVLLTICYVSHPNPTLQDFVVSFVLFIPHGELIMRIKSGFFTINAYFVGTVLSISM